MALNMRTIALSVCVLGMMFGIVLLSKAHTTEVATRLSSNTQALSLSQPRTQESSSRSCAVPHATSARQTFDHATQRWGPCSVQECERDFVAAPDKCVPRASQLAVDGTYNCAVRIDESVICWGRVDEFHEPDGLTMIDGKVEGFDAPIRMLDVANEGSCGVTSTGTVWCWGNTPNTTGENRYETWDALAYERVPEQVILPARAEKVVVDPNRACALLVDGSVSCWGQFEGPEASKTDTLCATEPTRVLVTERIVTLENGNCGETAKGGRVCWEPEFIDGSGEGEEKACRYDSRDLLVLRVLPTRKAKSQNTKPALSNRQTTKRCGNEHLECIINEAAQVLCRGNAAIRFSDGVTLSEKSFRRVGIEEAESLDCSESHVCAVTRSGAIMCAGSSESGRLGDGKWNEHSAAAPVKGLSGVKQVIVAVDHACALTEAGRVACWGDNSHGQLGGIDGSARSSPVWVDRLADVVQLSVGQTSSCALDAAGRVECWGVDAAVPKANRVASMRVAIDELGSDGDPPVHISGGAAFGCAALRSGRVRCWQQDAVAWADPGSRAVDVFDVIGVQNANKVSVYDSLACAVSDTGRVSCWGDGVFTPGPREWLREVLQLSRAFWVRDLDLQGMCLRFMDRSADCWAPPPIGRRVWDSSFAVSGHRDSMSCAIEEGGLVSCCGSCPWPFNAVCDYGYHADHSVELDQPAVSLSVSVNAGCAVVKDKTVRCWGDNTNGLLGIDAGLWMPRQVVLD
jgi:alpha-tubulin suppressor-like RCC1 family protein